jgi:hypothetical protein
MDGEVAECPDMPPGDVRVAVSQRLGEAASDLPKQEQSVEDGITQYPVFIPFRTADATQVLADGRVVSTRSATYRSSRRIQDLRIAQDLIADDPVQAFLWD